MKILKQIKSRLGLPKSIRRMVLRLMPKALRHRMIRKNLRFEYELSPRITFRVAQTEVELESALKLLHDRYVKSGLMDPHPSGLRVTKYHALPSTTTLIAVLDGKVIGTVSLIRRSTFGLPMEKIFDLSAITERGQRVIEVSALAIDPEYSGQHGHILFPMIKFLIQYSCQYFGANYFAIAVHPHWLEFYEAALFFTPLKQKIVDKYSFVKGAPAAGGIISADDLAGILQKGYGETDTRKNGYDYFMGPELPNFQFPDRTFKKISDPVLTPELIDHFFNKRTQTLSEMTEEELLVIHQMYQDPNFTKILPSLSPDKSSMVLRKETRFDINASGAVELSNGKNIPFVLGDLSSNGMSVFADRGLRVGEKYKLKVDIGGPSLITLSATVRWRSDNQHGLQIVESVADWKRFVEALTKDLYRGIA